MDLRRRRPVPPVRHRICTERDRGTATKELLPLLKKPAPLTARVKKAGEGDKSQMQEQGIAYFNCWDYGSSDSTVLFTVVIA
jgi:hypothetical protein